MKLGIMQPYLFPYIGYFSLIQATDQWIVFDTPQYIRKGWVNRNRVLKENEKWKYLSIPVVKAPRETPINKIEINNVQNWKQDLMNGLSYYQKIKAPFFSDVETLVALSLDHTSENLSGLILHSLNVFCNYLQIEFPFRMFSEMSLDLGVIVDSGEWALRICEALDADTYINPPGGRAIFNKDKFKQKGIELFFLEHHLPVYDQKIGTYIPGLSIIDVLMFNSVIDTQEMIRDYSLVT